MNHEQLLNESTRAILAVYTDHSESTHKSLIELENFIRELIIHIEVFRETN